MRVDDILARLEGVSGGSGQWHARCPAHDDRQASLTIGVGREGQTLLTCWAGCELGAIVAALGLTVRDLFDASPEDVETQTLGRTMLAALEPKLPDLATLERFANDLQRDADRLARIFELKGWRADGLAALGIGASNGRLTIPVLDIDGAVVINVLRYWPELTPKMLATRGCPRAPLYALVDELAPIWIVEGETDAISLSMLGLNVIGAPGASAKARAEWLLAVRGRQVFVCFDADEPGRRAALRWAAAAHEAGAGSVLIVDLPGPKGYDVSDLLHEHRRDPGTARSRLYALAQQARPYQPPQPVTVVDAPPELADETINGLATGTLISRPLATFRPKRLRMLWRDRIPVGRVGIIFGPPGQGKSTLLSLIVADVTKIGGRVIIASAEDVPETTLLPRMAAAGADVGLVDIVSTKASKGETSLVLPRDLDALAARMPGAAMLLVDPLSAHLGDDINSWREQDVRAQVLAPLGHHANVTGCAAPLVMHMNKSNSTDALARISGSGGFGAAARFALLLGTHPDDVGIDNEDERRLVLVHVKASESAKQPAMIFRRVLVPVQTDDGIAAMPTLELLDERIISADAVLESTSVDEASAYGEAVEFLRVELADGAKLAARLLKTARERGDFSERTLRKAKHSLGVKSTRDTEGWWWSRA